MKFRCERDVLVDALATAGRAVSSRGALPVLSGIRAELQGDELLLSGTDLELSISVTVTVAGSGDGVAVIPSRLFNDIVRALEPGAVEVEIVDDTAQVSAGRSQFSLRLIPADDFPRVAEPTGDALAVDAKTLAQALRQVVPAASSDDSRPILTGVLVAAEAGGLRLVATDSYRLAVRDLVGASVLAEGQSVLLPSRALAELTRLLSSADSVDLRLGEREASFEAGRSRLTTRLIEGEFPNDRNLIPRNHPNRLTVSREVLLDAVRRVRLLARESTPVRLAHKADSLELLAITQDVGQAHESVDASFDGTELTVAFNPEYLIAGLEAVTADEVVLESLDARNPAVLRGVGNEDFFYLLMPVRVS
ncbi:MAG: DNA polymerase III subunit beta [Acidimicrobiales bacterium]|nr:DNA polymerase III subunit beta [Acidimicrobiales bacterium]